MKLSRTNTILSKMKEQGITHALVSDPYSIFYLTGFLENPGERFFAILLDENGNHKLFLNILFPLEEDLGLEIVSYSDTDDIISKVAEYIPDGTKLGIDKIFPARFLLPLMDKLPKTKFVDVSVLVDTTRMLKDEEEKELMRISSELNDKACQFVIDNITERTTEKDLVKKLLAYYEEIGVEGTSFPPIIAFGDNGANPHGMPGDRKPKPGESVIVDIGGIKDKYCSDMTRTVFFKQPTPEDREVFEIVLEAVKRGTALVKPGTRLCDIDAACRDYITEKGYGEYFTHRTGHQIGLEDHEYGDVSSTNEMVCEPGMIFSIEPGIYLPGRMGVRIEDLVLVTEDGVEVLNKLNKEFVVVGEK